MHAVVALVVALLLCQPVPAVTQTQSVGQSAEAELVAKFRAWITKLPPEGRPSDVQDALNRYRAVLASEGLDPSAVDRQIRIIVAGSQRREAERWNRILTAPNPTFNTKPNAFLVEMTRNIIPGKALDVGMGEGRNAIYLAQQGWDVTGFDPADKAIALAQERAKQLNLSLAALVARDDQFDFGKQRWDLIVLSYVGMQQMVPRLYEALKPGGLVIVEAFHRDATKTASIGGAVVFDTNELLKVFERFRIVRYDDVEGVGDFGQQKTRLVRLVAQKP